MLCTRCEARGVTLPGRRGAPSPARVWGIERLGDLLCARCGSLLAGEDVARRLLQKQSQLAQFGLSGFGRRLLEPTRREDG